MFGQIVRGPIEQKSSTVNQEHAIRDRGDFLQNVRRDDERFLALQRLHVSPEMSVNTDSDATNDEDGNATTDANRSLVIRAIGYGQNSASAELEAIIAPQELPAIITDGDLMISGNPSVVTSAEGGCTRTET